MAQEDEHPKLGRARLTEGELICLRMVAEGMGSKQIARTVGISPHTVDARLKSACQKLGTRSRFVAANMIKEPSGNQEQVTVTSPEANLAYENLGLLDHRLTGDKASSAEEGDGSGDLEKHRHRQLETQGDSGRDRGWFEPNNPIAKFFGGENRLSIGERLLIISAIALAFAFAFGLLVNGAIGLSRMLASS
ncbi:helix-turn-helix domain-containing protein [Sphingopyxis sp. MG]|uniref:helix-turn-helix domain-containing protein n=1 Tax=Sphingopyxis sp. MG TaxID=1866325 RepID=UPI001319EBA4|nr:helix-turn-helix transcriptional regulator [Sphingopyxis sp. MG]